MRLPENAVLEITARCNHKCLFCSCPWEHKTPRPEKELTSVEWENVMLRYSYHGVKQVTFTGGEPTLRGDLPRLIAYARDLGYVVGLITNGRAVTKDLLRTFREYGVYLSISVPGIETFAEHTGVDNIDNVLNLFKTCKEMGLSTVANIAVTKKNLKELYENISYPLINGAGYVLLNRFLPGGRGMKHKDLLLSLDELNEMFDVAEEVLQKADIDGHIGTELPYCAIRTPQKYKRLQIASRCGAAKSFFVTDPEGFIKVCNHSPVKVCRWNEVFTLKDNAYWRRFTDRDYIPKMCGACRHLDICDGGCREAAHIFYGEIDNKDPCLNEA